MITEIVHLNITTTFAQVCVIHTVYRHIFPSIGKYVSRPYGQIIRAHFDASYGKRGKAHVCLYTDVLYSSNTHTHLLVGV